MYYFLKNDVFVVTGKLIFEEQNKKLKKERKIYTGRKEVISKRKISNLGFDGYIIENSRKRISQK